jgi:2-hydroxychromene-2-carboxylate isomerase
MTAPTLDFWFDFASTYYYPAAMRVRALASAVGVKVKFRPFLLGPIFKAQGWTTSPFNLFPAKGRNMWRDLERICAGLSLPPMRRPEPFPQNSVLAARVALVGLVDQWGEEFCRAVFRAEFADGRRIDDTETMGRHSFQAQRRAVGGARGRAVGRQQSAAAGRNRRGAKAWPVRR